MQDLAEEAICEFEDSPVQSIQLKHRKKLAKKEREKKTGIEYLGLYEIIQHVIELPEQEERDNESE